MDHLWGHAKEAMCGNRQYATIELLVERFLEYLEGCPVGGAHQGRNPLRGLLAPSVMSKNFW